MRAAVRAAGALSALLCMVLPPAAHGQAVQHPLYPSQRAVTSELLHSGGVPAEPLERPTAPAVPADTIARGQVLYDEHCITCHGAKLQGTGDGPSLLHAGGAAVDFFVSTGRMPLGATGVEDWHQADYFDAAQTAALVAFVNARAQRSPPIPTVVLRPEDLQRGRFLFEQNCEACHGAAAQGADAGYGWIAPALDRASPRQIGEAVRIGPGIMPVFTSAQLSDRDIDALATYVRYVTTKPANPGGTPFGYLGPLAEGAIAWGIGIGGLFFVIFFTGTTSRGGRLNEPH